jgi:hypothetical protein
LAFIGFPYGYKALHANVPPYISDLLTPKHIGCYSLRSNEQNFLIVSKTMRKTFGDRAFAKAFAKTTAHFVNNMKYKYQTKFEL